MDFTLGLVVLTGGHRARHKYPFHLKVALEEIQLILVAVSVTRGSGLVCQGGDDDLLVE